MRRAARAILYIWNIFFRDDARLRDMNALIWLAVVLVVIWLLVKFVFVLTGMLFHLLWIAAIVLFMIWLVRKVL